MCHSLIEATQPWGSKMSAVISNHARIRGQQRRIPNFVIEMLIQYGDVSRNHHGADVYFFSKNSLRELMADMDEESKKFMRKASDTYAVITPGDIVITAGYLQKKKLHH